MTEGDTEVEAGDEEVEVADAEVEVPNEEVTDAEVEVTDAEVEVASEEDEVPNEEVDVVPHTRGDTLGIETLALHAEGRQGSPSLGRLRSCKHADCRLQFNCPHLKSVHPFCLRH